MNSIISQNLTIEQILNLQKKDVVEIEEYLSSKDWSLLNIEKESDVILGSITFAYGKLASNDRAESFLFCFYSDDRKRIIVQVHDKEKYNLYLKSVKRLGYKLVDKKIENNKIDKVYQNPSTTIIISISTAKDDGSTDTVYSYLVLSNDDYLLNYKN